MSITVVLEVGSEWIVYEADDWREALAIASNLLSMQEKLRPGWTLRMEAGEGPRAKVPLAN